MLAGEFAVVGDGEAEQQLRVDAGREADLERAELVGAVGLDLDRLLGEAVQPHQRHQRVRAVGLAAEAAGDRRRVDRVVEVGVADEHADDLAGRLDEAVERRRVGQRRAAQQQVGEGDPREVGVDEQRLALVAEPVAGDAEPFDLEPGRQLQRPRLQLAQRLAVVALGRAPRRPRLRQLAEVSQRARPRRATPSATRRRELGRAGERLEDDAVALGQLQQGLRAARASASVSSSNARRIAEKPTGASRSTASVPRKSRSPSARTRARPHLDPQRGRDRAQRHPGAGDQRLEQHVARAELACRRRRRPGAGRPRRSPGRSCTEQETPSPSSPSAARVIDGGVRVLARSAPSAAPGSPAAALVPRLQITRARARQAA